MPDYREQLITGVDVRQYFQSAVSDALDGQNLAVRDETVIYLVNLLTGYVRAESFYERTPEGTRIRPLAELYGNAVTARMPEDRDRALQRLGDVALFVSGLFANSLSRSLVDVDYYIAMGGNAYGYLARSHYVGRSSRTLREVFADLAARFTDFVDVLAEVGDNAKHLKNNDLLRLYEIWLCTGSRRVADRLRQAGIDPVSTRRHTH